MSPDTVEQAAAAAAVLHGPGHSKAQDAAKAHPAPAAASKVGARWPVTLHWGLTAAEQLPCQLCVAA